MSTILETPPRELDQEQIAALLDLVDDAHEVRPLTADEQEAAKTLYYLAAWLSVIAAPSVGELHCDFAEFSRRLDSPPTQLPRLWRIKK